MVAPVPPTAVNLAFDAAEAATRAVFFFDGAILTLNRLFEEEKGFGIGITLSVNSKISMKALKFRDKFLGEFIYTQIVN